MFLLNFFNVNIEKVISCVCHMHAHDFSTPVHSLSFWDVNICKTCWGTEVANSFFPCIARLWNSVPAYCFPLSYNLHLFKGSISMHLASLTITWKPTNKNIGNFISYLNSKLINWFEKWRPVFDISHIIWSHSRCNCIYFGTLQYYSYFYASTSVYYLRFLLVVLLGFFGFFWNFRVLLRIVKERLLERHLQPSFMHVTKE